MVTKNIATVHIGLPLKCHAEHVSKTWPCRSALKRAAASFLADIAIFSKDAKEGGQSGGSKDQQTKNQLPLGADVAKRKPIGPRGDVAAFQWWNPDVPTGGAEAKSASCSGCVLVPM